jgi:diguanylate cyclase (GGDEF)-like protein
MWDRSVSRSTAIRAAFVVSSMLLCSAVIAGGAPAQSLPTTDLQPTGGIGVTTGPDGVGVDVDAGEPGGVSLDAGSGGLKLGLRGPVNATVPVGEQPGNPVSVPRAPAADAPSRNQSPGTSSPGGGRGGVIQEVVGDPRRARGRVRGDASGKRSAAGGHRNSPAAAARLRAAKTADRDDRGGVAPVFDLVERIPAAVRAALVALGLIAIALWALWVRGRRRLQHNAYQDPVTGVANLAAFEEVLDREWQRAARYRRPLGLLLLDLGERGGRGLLGERDARAAVDGINWEVRESDTVARLAPSRFAVISPEAPQGSIETLAHALEHRLEERRLRCWAGVAERHDADESPGDLITRAAAALADAQGQAILEDVRGYDSEDETAVFAGARGSAAAA